MFRDILTNKWVIGGVVFLIVFSVACVFWYRYDTASDRKSAAETAELLRQWAAKKVDTDDKVEQAADASVKSITPTVEKPVNKITATEVKAPNVTTTGLTEISKNQNEERFSPFGFGPYPPLPDDPFWVPETFPSPTPEHELMKRVWIKLLSEGVDVKGVTMKRGLVFPIIKGIRYVQWASYEGPFGDVKYIARSTGHPDDGERLRTVADRKKERHESFTEADVPSGIILIPYEEGGIDPYSFLNLP